MQFVERSPTKCAKRFSDLDRTEFDEIRSIITSDRHPIEQILRDEELERVLNEMTNIRDRDSRIIAARYGLFHEEKTLQEIADELGITRERVRQIQSRGEDELRYRLHIKAANGHTGPVPNTGTDRNVSCLRINNPFFQNPAPKSRLAKMDSSTSSHKSPSPQVPDRERAPEEALDLTAPQQLIEIAADVLQQNRRRRAKVRTLLGWFGYYRRRDSIVKEINESLESLGLETDPSFEDEFIDNQVYFVARGIPETGFDGEIDEVPSDPDSKTDDLEIKEYIPPVEISEPVELSFNEHPSYRVSHFASARKPVISVSPQDCVSHAKTTLLMKDFDQLPVLHNQREVKGVISWKTIAQAEAAGKQPESVSQCMVTAQIVEQGDSMFDAVSRVLKYGCVLVRNKKREISGIITQYDVANQFHDLAEPYLLVGEIERLIRNMIAENFTHQDIQLVRQEGEAEIKDVTDMTFGQYQRLLENPENWSRLSINVERKIFIEKLVEVREARNDVMHFDPEGFRPHQKRHLWEFASFLNCLC